MFWIHKNLLLRDVWLDTLWIAWCLSCAEFISDQLVLGLFRCSLHMITAMVVLFSLSVTSFSDVSCSVTSHGGANSWLVRLL